MFYPLSKVMLTSTMATQLLEQGNYFFNFYKAFRVFKVVIFDNFLYFLQCTVTRKLH